MPRVSREQTEQNRTLIEAASMRLLKERGINGVSVADIMTEAGMTHGGFYGHFDSKDELVAHACEQAFERSNTMWQSFLDEGGTEDQLVASLAKDYLAPRQRDDPGSGCPIVAFASDVSREGADKPVRKTYTTGIRGLVDILASFGQARRSKKAQSKALARMAMLVGAVAISRATAGDPMSDDILEAALKHVSLRAD